MLKVPQSGMLMLLITGIAALMLTAYGKPNTPSRLNDFIIGSRVTGPSVLWYRRGVVGWTQYEIDDSFLPSGSLRKQGDYKQGYCGNALIFSNLKSASRIQIAN